MKKLLTLLLALVVMPVPTSFASDDATLASQDLHEYLVFEPGTWWTYDNTVDNLVAETSTTVPSTITQSACDGTDDCYTMTTEVDGSNSDETVYIADNTATYSNYNDTELSQEYVTLTVGAYSQMIPDEDYTAFGFTTFDSGATSVSCDYELDTDYNFQDQSYTAIVENCTLTTAIDGTRIRMFTESAYLKGLGLVDSVSQTYVGTIEFIDTTMTLTDSSLIVPVSPFSDVALTDTNYDAIKYLYDLGVLVGYADGTFRPDTTVNRAELITILVEGSGVTPDVETYNNCFTDVGMEWYASYVCYAKEQGWIEGYVDGSFKPANPVNRAESLVMLLLSQDVSLADGSLSPYKDVEESDWFAPYVQTASELGILEEPGTYFHPEADRKREEIAENLYRLLMSL